MIGANVASMPTTTPATTDTMNPLNCMTFLSIALFSLRSVHLSNIEESLSAPLLASKESILARAAMNRSSSPDELFSETTPANAFSTEVPRRIFLTASRSPLLLDSEKTPTNAAASPRPLDDLLRTARSFLITSSSSAVVAEEGSVIVCSPPSGSFPRDGAPREGERDVEDDHLQDEERRHGRQTRPLR